MVTDLTTTRSTRSTMSTTTPISSINKNKTYATVKPFSYVNKKEFDVIMKSCPSSPLPLYDVTYNSFSSRRDFAGRNVCDVCDEFICVEEAPELCDKATANNPSQRSPQHYQPSHQFTASSGGDDNGGDGGGGGGGGGGFGVEVRNNFENLTRRSCKNLIRKFRPKCVGTEGGRLEKVEKHVTSSEASAVMHQSINKADEAFLNSNYYCCLCRPEVNNCMLTQHQLVNQKAPDSLKLPSNNTSHQPFNQQAIQPFNQPMNQPFKQLSKRTSNQSGNQAFLKATRQGVYDQFHPCVQITCPDNNRHDGGAADDRGNKVNIGSKPF